MTLRPRPHLLELRSPRLPLLLALILSVVLAACSSASTSAPATSQAKPTAAPAAQAAAPAKKLEKIKLDYAYYSPTSLVLKQKGWAEEAFKAQGTQVEWVLSAGSNKANEFVRSNAVDFGSTAGAAALLERTNGTPLKSVYIYEQPEWTALVVAKDSQITDPKQLKGKKVAATKGTDPFFFLLRTLGANGLSGSDVEIVNIQHDQGRVALERGQVDAWAGLDPHMAASELQAGSKLLYRNRDFNTYGTLNTREDFLRDYPEQTKTVIQVYEQARKWTLENQEEAAKILAESSEVELPVARKELFERMNLKHDPVPGDAVKSALQAVVPILTKEELVKPDSNPQAALDGLLEPKFAKEVVK